MHQRDCHGGGAYALKGAARLKHAITDLIAVWATLHCFAGSSQMRSWQSGRSSTQSCKQNGT